jgi:hypothetical protein
MMKVESIEIIIEKEVPRRVGGMRNITNSLRRRRCRFIGHILRHISPLKTVLEGKISGKN